MVDLHQPLASRFVHRGVPGLLQKLPNHRHDPQQLGRLRDGLRRWPLRSGRLLARLRLSGLGEEVSIGTARIGSSGGESCGVLTLPPYPPRSLPPPRLLMKSASASAMRSTSDRSTLSLTEWMNRALIHRAPDQHLDAGERLREHRNQRDRTARAELDRFATVGLRERLHRRTARQRRRIHHVARAPPRSQSSPRTSPPRPRGRGHGDEPPALDVPRPGRHRARAGGSRELERRARSGSTNRRSPGRPHPTRRRPVMRRRGQR